MEYISKLANPMYDPELILNKLKTLIKQIEPPVLHKRNRGQFELNAVSIAVGSCYGKDSCSIAFCKELVRFWIDAKLVEIKSPGIYKLL